MQTEKVISRGIFLWMFFVSIFITYLHNQSKIYNKFYNFGPNTSLIILGFTIDTYYRYFYIIGYCFVNSVFRSLFHNVLTSWVTNSVQDITRPKPITMHMFAYVSAYVSAYESAYIITLYTWFDWFLYYNILLSQIDVLLIEIVIDLIMAGFVTKYYLANECIIHDYDVKATNKSEYTPILEYNNV